MTRREQFIAGAMSCIGTPTRHQGRLPGVGLDCVGVPIAALRAAGIVVEVAPYGNLPSFGQLEFELRRYADEVPVDQRERGDILAMREGRALPHAAVLVQRGQDGEFVVVARSGIGRVVLRRLGNVDRISSVWRVRGLWPQSF